MLVRECQIYRKIMCWIFAIIAVVCLWIVLYHITYIIRYYYTHLSLLMHFSLRILIVPVLFALLAYIFGMAWWTVWKDKTSAKSWGIVASLINILVMLRPFIRHSHSLSGRQWELLAIGIAGLIAFMWPDKEESEIYNVETYEVETDNTKQTNNHTERR